MSAGTSTAQDDSVAGLQWATENPRNAKIVNHSAGVNAGSGWQSISIGYDYWAKANNALVIVAAGNEAGYVNSPANGYNVLAIGSIHNKDTGDWADDELSSFSSWQNPAVPNTTVQDREKPEVVAVGQSIVGWGASNSQQLFPSIVGNPPGGTSYAAPQVAGLAALMHSKNSTLKTWPESARAIILASAAHDILEMHQSGANPDQKDGAGAIVGDLAVETAATLGSVGTTCTVSCWWHDLMNDVARGSSRLFTFTAQPGQRIRVAISWWASPDSARLNDATYLGEYKLNTDLDLRIKGPSGNTLAASTSFDNNYEWVDFDAPQSGTYTIDVLNTFNTSPTALVGYVGVAVVKISAWQGVAGWLKEVSVGCDGTAWAVNANGAVFRWDAANGIWVSVAGSLAHVSVGNASNIWGVNANGGIFRWNGSTWINVAGWLKQVAVGCDGTVLGLNNIGSIFRWNSMTLTWDSVVGSLNQISVGNVNRMWGVNANGGIYQWNGSTWVSVSGSLKQVSVSGDGDVWAVNGSDTVFHWDSRFLQWVSHAGSLATISVGNAGNVWGVNSGYSVYRR